MKEIDFEELEKEIDKAIDTLFVTKEEASEKPAEGPVEAAVEELEEGVIFQADEELQKKLEGIEVELLTLEWEFKPEGIRRAIGLLQEVRELELPETMEKATELLQKALHRFMVDDSNVTPEGVKFVQDLWRFLKGVAEGRELSSERLGVFESEYERLFEGIVSVPSKPKTEAIPSPSLEELLRTWERMESILSEAITRIQELRTKVAEERRGLLNRVPPAERKRQMMLFRVGSKYLAFDPKTVAKTVTVAKDMAAAFLRRGAVRLRDGTIPLHPLSGPQRREFVGNPQVVIFRTEEGLKGLVADESLGRGEVTVISSDRGRWMGKEVEVVK